VRDLARDTVKLVSADPAEVAGWWRTLNGAQPSSDVPRPRRSPNGAPQPSGGTRQRRQ
jgi:hypothetical protein